MQDIILNVDSSDLEIKAGDWLVDESTRQHQKLLIESDKGAWRQHPAAGVGIQRYLLDEAPGDLVTAVKTELRADGMTVHNVKLNINTGTITVEAEYE